MLGLTLSAARRLVRPATTNIVLTPATQRLLTDTLSRTSTQAAQLVSPELLALVKQGHTVEMAVKTLLGDGAVVGKNLIMDVKATLRTVAPPSRWSRFIGTVKEYIPTAVQSLAKLI